MIVVEQNRILAVGLFAEKGLRGSHGWQKNSKCGSDCFQILFWEPERPQNYSQGVPRELQNRSQNAPVNALLLGQAPNRPSAPKPLPLSIQTLTFGRMPVAKMQFFRGVGAS